VAPIISGIWLLLLGEWKFVFGSIAGIVALGFLLMLLLMVNLPLAMFTMYLRKRDNIIWFASAYIGVLYTNLLILCTCLLVYSVCTAHHAVGLKLIPYLMWSWSLALGLWQYFADDESNGYSILTIFVTSVFYLLVLVAHMVHPVFLVGAILLFIAVELVILPIGSLYIECKTSEYLR